MGALGVGAEGGARISLFVLFRCYSVTESWKPLPILAFRRNRICNVALSASLQSHRPRLPASLLRTLRRKKPRKPQHRSPAVTLPVTLPVTRSVTKSVTDDLLHPTDKGSAHLAIYTIRRDRAHIHQASIFPLRSASPKCCEESSRKSGCLRGDGKPAA